jgi:hypothetical protein
MGEAVYHLIAEFKSYSGRDRAEKLVKPILDEVFKFADDWQDIRDDTKTSPKKRYNQLMEKYPIIKAFFKLPIPKENDTSLNCIAGLVDITEDYSLTTDKKQIRLSCLVWHFAKWEPFVNLFYQLGATHCAYFSDEYVEDMLNYIDVTRFRKPEHIKPLTQKQLDIITVELL